MTKSFQKETINQINILIINNAEPGITEFTDPVVKILEKSGAKTVTTDYSLCSSLSVDDFDGVIMSGSPQGNDIVEHHLPYFRWLVNYKKPVLGICAGHHITGVLFGAELFKSKEPESGIIQVSVIQDDPIFEGINEILEVMQIHNDSISVPSDFMLLATSSSCNNQIMRHKHKCLYTCQFHPEFFNHQLIVNFTGLCKYSEQSEMIV